MAQTINVDTTPGLFMPTLHYSQNDVGREWVVNLSSKDGYSIPTGATVKMVATKPSGLGFTLTGSLSGNTATFTTTDTVTNEAGRFPAEIQIIKNSTVIGTANFWLEGEPNPHPEGTTDGDIDNILPQFMSVAVTTLPAGSDATYSFNAATNTATFGIPKGADGSLASGVLAPTYSVSAKYEVGDYVYYSGDLYRCITAITTGEAWTAGHWTQVALAPEVSDLKSDINLVSGFGSNLYDSSDATDHKRLGSGGGTVDTDAGTYNDCFVSDYIEVSPGYQYQRKPFASNIYHRIAYYDDTKTTITVSESEQITTAPDNAKYARFNAPFSAKATAEFYLISAIDNKARKDIEIIKDDIDAIDEVVSLNVYTTEGATSDAYLAEPGHTPVSYTGALFTDYLPVKSSKNYALVSVCANSIPNSKNLTIYEYDSNFDYLSKKITRAITSDDAGKRIRVDFTTSQSTAYIIMSIGAISYLSNIVIAENGIVSAIDNYARNRLESVQAIAEKASAAVPIYLALEQGAIDGSGGHLDHNKRVKTKDFICGAFEIETNTGYLVFKVCRYLPDGTYVDRIYDVTGEGTSKFSVKDDQYFYKIVFANDDFDVIAPDENIVKTIYRYSVSNEVRERMVSVKTDYVMPDDETVPFGIPASYADVLEVYNDLATDFPNIVTKSLVGKTRSEVTMTVSSTSNIAIRNTYKVQGQDYSFAVILIDGNNLTGTIIGESDTFVSSGKLTDDNGTELCDFSNAVMTEGYSIYKYYFCFGNSVNDSVAGKTLYKNNIFIAGGVHGEYRALYGHMRFFYNLLNNWKNNDILSEIRQCVDFIVIPTVNPWAIDHGTQYNIYGVDINRNCVPSFVETERSTTRWSGYEPLSEPESQILHQQFMNEAGKCIAFVDFHNDSSQHYGCIYNSNENFDQFTLSFARSMSNYCSRYFNATANNLFRFVKKAPDGAVCRQAEADGFASSHIVESSPALLSTDGDKLKSQVGITFNTLLALTRYYSEG